MALFLMGTMARHLEEEGTTLCEAARFPLARFGKRGCCEDLVQDEPASSKKVNCTGVNRN